jgi:Uma2 family endonuclease
MKAALPPRREMAVESSAAEIVNRPDTIERTMSTTHSKPKTRRPRYGPGSAGVRLTPEEFDAAPAWEWDKHHRYELINGVLVVTPPVDDAEADPNDELGFLLRTYRETHREGSSLDATLPERTVPGTANRRRCDRAIWTGLGRPPDTRGDVPSVLVEFVSRRRRDYLRDYEQKRDEYLAAGVKEYWVIDRFRRIMTVYLPGPLGPTYEVVTETQSYQTTLLPGFVLPLARLLSRADQWTRPRTRPDRTPPAGGTDG